MPHTEIKPIRLREHSPELAVDVSRIVAYRSSCGCGWRGPSRETYQAAQRDARKHTHP